MNLLKLTLTIFPTLVLLNYLKRVDEIILTIDASSKEWRKILIQLVQRKRYLSRYEKEIWSSIEKNYNATE